MYNAYKFKKDQEKIQAEKDGVKHPRDRNPEAAIKKRDVLANQAKMRRETFINKCDLDENQFEILNNGGNDSLAFKTSHYDFRGEKGRDKSLDISPQRFRLSSFMTTTERVTHAESQAKAGLFSERNHQKEERINQQLRPRPKVDTSPLGFQNQARSEAHRISEQIKSKRRFEPEFFNANRMIQPDQFRIEMRHQESKWVDTQSRFLHSHKNKTSPNSRNQQFRTTSGQMSFNGGPFDPSMASTLRSNQKLGSTNPDLKLQLNHLSKEYEPFTKINLTSERGIGDNIDKAVSPLHSVRQSPFQGQVGTNRATSHSQMERQMMTNDQHTAKRLANKRMSQKQQNKHILTDDYGQFNNSISNRFYDTFTKLQVLNANLEFSPMPAFGKNHHQSPKGMSTSQQDNKGFQPATNEKDEKLQTITEFLKQGDLKNNTYYTLNEVIADQRKDSKNRNLSFQQRTQHNKDINEQWKNFSNHMNKDFFDNNKLYLKSVVDYKTRYHKKPNPIFLVGAPQNGVDKTKFPQINSKKATEILNSRGSANSGSVGDVGENKSTAMMGEGSVENLQRESGKHKQMIQIVD